MQKETIGLSEAARLDIGAGAEDGVRWRVKWQLLKFHEADVLALGLDPATATEDQILAAGGVPYETIEREGNLLMYGGASCLWQTLIGNGTGTGGQALTYFDNSNAAIGVGDSTTAAAATQTDLQAATNKLRKAMDATYPQHTDATTSGAASIIFKSTFATGDANFAWDEWGVFNSPTAATGRMLNRKVEALGTKSSGSWALTITLSLA